jgi:hypothetical protein
MLHLALLRAAIAAAPAPTGPGIDAAVIGDTFARFNAVAHTPLPVPAPDQLQELADGAVVTLVHRRGDLHYMVVGVARTGLPKEQVYLSTQDPHYSGDARVEANVSKGPNKATWYGLLDIPRPWSDRHWVIDVWDNVPLARRSGNVWWEHPWQMRVGGLKLVRPRVERGEVHGLTLAMFEDAVETPANEGALDFLELPGDDSLFVYAIVSDAGPGVPERLIAAFVRRQMAGFLSDVIDRARDEVPAHYRAPHPPVLGVDGEPIPYYP